MWDQIMRETLEKSMMNVEDICWDKFYFYSLLELKWMFNEFWKNQKLADDLNNRYKF